MDQSTQVGTSHYDFERYVSYERWFSYYTQINEILKLGPSSVLVVGPGDHILVQILISKGIEVETVDIESKFDPTYKISILEISQNIEKKYDLVVCFQVLEHLEFKYFETGLQELKSVSLGPVFISLPYKSYRFFNSLFMFPKGKLFFLSIFIPKFFQRHTFDGEHYWEVGARNYPKKQIIRGIQKIFKKVSSFHIKGNPYHIFYKCD